MEKKIYVSEKNKAHLREVFGCSTVMVWKALNFKSDSDLAQKIRYTALMQLNQLETGGDGNDPRGGRAHNNTNLWRACEVSVRPPGWYDECVCRRC